MLLPYMYPPGPYALPYPLRPAYGKLPLLVTGRPRLSPLRAAEVRLRVHPGMGWGYSAAAIEPGLLFFSHGNPIGGPSQSYRGVAASRFPVLADVLGPGAPLAEGGLGIAGAPI